MSDGLKPENFEDLPQINEHNFVKNYLPLLIRNDDPNARMVWLDEVAKQPTISVEVVDDDDHSKVLFRVPPLFYSPETRTGTNMGNLINNGLEKTRVRRSASFINEAVSALQEVVNSQEAPEEDVKQWRWILERYGYLKPTGVDKEEPNAENNRSVSYKEEDW